MNKWITALIMGITMALILLPYFIIEINKDKSPKIKKPEIKEIEFKPKDSEEKIKNDVTEDKNNAKTTTENENNQ